jgi:hypothetical protein
MALLLVLRPLRGSLQGLVRNRLWLPHPAVHLITRSTLGYNGAFSPSGFGGGKAPFAVPAQIIRARAAESAKQHRERALQENIQAAVSQGWLRCYPQEAPRDRPGLFPSKDQ